MTETDCTCPAHALAASRRFLCAEDVDVVHRLAEAMPTDRKRYAQKRASS